MGEAAIAATIASHTFDELLKEIGEQDNSRLGKLNRKLTQAVRRLVARYGVKVKSCRIGNFAIARVFKLVNS